jgi:hypothetical protein
MTRRPHLQDPEELRRQLIELLENFEKELRGGNLRKKVQALIPAHHLLRDLGSSLIPFEGVSAARDRILQYLLKYPKTVIKGEELMVVAGIGEWARRVRELRVQFGWSILTGVTGAEMADEGVQVLPGTEAMRPDDYFLTATKEDRDSAHRWNIANDIRKGSGSVRDKILQYFQRNIGVPISGEELRYVAKDRTEWARRVRELRTEFGWPVVTKNTGRPDLPIGFYLLEQNRQSPAHDRNIPDPVRTKVLKRDGYACRKCGWSQKDWIKSDPRNLELHHIKHHVDGGENTEENLMTVCTVGHDEIHRKE